MAAWRGAGELPHPEDFRTAHEAALNELFTQLLAVLTQQGLVRLKRVAQDGMRVRVSAGASSFRRRGRLEDFLQAAREQVEAVKQQSEAGVDPQREKSNSPNWWPR